MRQVALFQVCPQERVLVGYYYHMSKLGVDADVLGLVIVLVVCLVRDIGPSRIVMIAKSPPRPVWCRLPFLPSPSVPS